MDWGKYLKYAAIGVAGYYVLAKAVVFGEIAKSSPFSVIFLGNIESSSATLFRGSWT